MQGLGYVTTEQLIVDSKSGKLLTDNFSTYKIPTVHDMPDKVIIYFHFYLSNLYCFEQSFCFDDLF